MTDNKLEEELLLKFENEIAVGNIFDCEGNDITEQFYGFIAEIQTKLEEAEKRGRLEIINEIFEEGEFDNLDEDTKESLEIYSQLRNVHTIGERYAIWKQVSEYLTNLKSNLVNK